MALSASSIVGRTLIEELEPRLLYSADLAPVLAEAALPQAEQRLLGVDGEFASAKNGPLAAQHARFEVVFIDLRVQDRFQILADIQQQNTDGRSIEVVLLDTERDGVAQIGDFLGRHQNVDAVHIISHGSAGSVQLGAGLLDFDSLLKNASGIKQWGNALSDQADILIYGCDLADSEAGQSLIGALGRLTGADVAASDDATGAARLGGDYELEYTVGAIDTRVVFSDAAQQTWAHVLAAPIAVSDAASTTENAVLTVSAPGVLANDTNPDTASVTAGATLSFTTDGDDVWTNQTATTGYNWAHTNFGTQTFYTTTPTTAYPGIVSAYQFSGTNSGAVMPNMEGLPGDPTNNSASFEIWFRPDVLSTSSGQQMLFETGGVTNGTSLYLDNTLLKFATRAGGFAADEVSVDLAALYANPTTEFIQVIGVIDLSGDQMKLYIDGSLRATKLFTGMNGSDWSGPDGAGLGRVFNDISFGPVAGSGTLDGDVAIFRFYEKALTATEATANFKAVTNSSSGMVVSQVQGNAANVGSQITLASGALLTMSADGAYTYNPNNRFEYLGAGQSTTDSFSYTVANLSGATDTATVTITVNGVNDAPVATNLNAAETYTEDTPLNLTDIVVSDIDSANVTVTLTLSNTAAGSLNTATSGTVTSTFAGGVWTASGAVANVNALLAGLTFTPAADFNAGFTVATRVSDGVAAALTGVKTFTGTPVNDAPTATNLNAAETYTEDTPLNLTDIVVSDVDSANVTVTLTLSNTAVGSLNTATSGTVTSSFAGGIWAASGAVADVNALLAGLTFTPAADFHANFSLATKVSDGVAAALTGTKAFTGTPVNDAPVATNLNAAETYTEDTPLNLTDIVVSDVDSANVTVTLTLSNTSAGALNTATSGTVTSTFAGGVWTASGAVADVNALLAALTFTPATDFNANFSIVTSVSDGVAAPITGVKLFTGTPVNDAPVATNLNAPETYTEDTPLNLTDIVVSDVDSANVTVTLTLSNVAAGSLNTATSGTVTSTFAGGVWTASGAVANVNALLAGLTFTPATDFNANFSIATSVSDGVAAALIGSKAFSAIAMNDAPSFGNGDGAVTTDFGAGDIAYAVAVQPDGKIVLAGSARVGGNDDFALTRYNSDGSLDTGFGSGGKVTTAISAGTDWAHGVAVQPDGKIVVTGRGHNGVDWDVTVVRYHADGSLDTSFGAAGTGIVRVDIGGANDVGNMVAIQGDGKIVVSARARIGSTDDFAVVRLNTDGTLDTSFGATGKVTTAIGPGNESGQRVTLPADGKIVVSGYSSNGSNNDFAVVRYHADGTLDVGFGGTGIVTTSIGTGNDTGSSAAVQVDGKIVVAGASYNGSNDDFAIVRYHADGTLDTGFGSSGIVITPVGAGTAQGQSVRLQADGKIVVGGLALVGGNSDFAVVRYHADGSLDGSFGVGGKTTLAIGPGNDASLEMALQPDGQILLAGRSSNGADDDFAVVRVGTGGTPDTGFDQRILNGRPRYTEDGAAVILDSDVQVWDAELAAADNYAGATLSMARSGGASAQDVFSASGNLSPLAQGGNLTLSGISIGRVTTNSAGTLQLLFNGNATQARVNEALQSIAYTHGSDMPPVSAQIDWVFDDGNTGAQGGGGSPAATGSAIVGITPVNDAPAASNLNADETYTEDTPLNLTDIVVSDVDSANVTVTLTLSNAAAGALNTATSGTVTSTFAGGVWTASGAVADVNALLAALTFTPATDFNANFSIATSVSDGVAAPITGVKPFTGTPVNDAPVATNLNAAETYTEDTPLNLTDIAVSDVDSANVTVTLTLSNTSAGALNTATSGTVTSTFAGGVWTASGAVADVNALLAALTFTPATDFNANFSIATSVSDGVAAPITGVKPFTGTPVNDAPVATNLNAPETYTEDTPLNLTDIVVSDVDSANVTVTLTLSNVAAGSLNTATSGTVTSTFAGGVWTASGVVANVNALLAGLTFTPAANFNAGFTVATSVSDGVAASLTGVKTFTGTPVNDTPVASNLNAPETYTEDTPLNLTDIVVSDIDSANVTVTLTLSNVASGSLATGTAGAVTSTYSPATGDWRASGATADINTLLAALTFTPAANFNGNFGIDVTISDGAASITGVKPMTGTAVNDAPTTSPVNLAAIAEDSGGRLITQAELLANANDVDGDGLNAIGLAISAGGGVLVDNLDGSWSYTPAADDDTAVSFSYAIVDGGFATPASALLDITPVSDQPTAAATTSSVVEGAAYGAASVAASSGYSDERNALAGPTSPGADSPVATAVVTNTPARVTVPAGDAGLNPIAPTVASLDARLRASARLPTAPTQDDTSSAQQFLTSSEMRSEVLLHLVANLLADTQAATDYPISPAGRVEIAPDESLREEIISRGAEITVATLSVGTVWWALRASGLLASLLTSMPAWRSFDLLPVLNRNANDEDAPWDKPLACATTDAEPSSEKVAP